MTTRLELAEMILESERTGRNIQEKFISDSNEYWNCCSGVYFDLDDYEYRLEPKKKIKRSGWVSACVIKMYAGSKPQKNCNGYVFVEWEEDE